MEQFALQIVTPDGVAFSGEAQQLIVRTIEGDVCILANHVQYLTALGIGMARMTAGGQSRRAACAGGMLAVTRGEDGKAQVRLAPTTFEWAEDIDAARAQRAREKAERQLGDAKDRQEQLMIQAKLSRALARLQAAGNK